MLIKNTDSPGCSKDFFPPLLHKRAEKLPSSVRLFVLQVANIPGVKIFQCCHHICQRSLPQAQGVRGGEGRPLPLPTCFPLSPRVFSPPLLTTWIRPSICLSDWNGKDASYRRGDLYPVQWKWRGCTAREDLSVPLQLWWARASAQGQRHVCFSPTFYKEMH